MCNIQRFLTRFTLRVLVMHVWFTQPNLQKHFLPMHALRQGELNKAADRCRT